MKHQVHTDQIATLSQSGKVIRAYQAANNAMHAAMAVELTENADFDFIQCTIHHHQGAIEMARVVLEHGSDLVVRELALAVIIA